MLLLLAAVFGAAHALTPGHGKTLVAAYLVGQRYVYARNDPRLGDDDYAHRCSARPCGFAPVLLSPCCAQGNPGNPGPGRRLLGRWHGSVAFFAASPVDPIMFTWVGRATIITSMEAMPTIMLNRARAGRGARNRRR